LLFLPDAFRSNATDIARLKPHVIAQSKDYGGLEQPTVILTGTEDTVVWPSIHSEGLLRDLPNAELVVLEGAGHMPHHTRTDAIVEALDRLVLRVGRASVLDCRSSAQKRAASCRPSGNFNRLDRQMPPWPSVPTNAIRNILVDPGVPNGTPAVMMIR
jgi:hypothetical protein